MPWSEGYRTALVQNDTVLFATARVAGREESFKWAGPFAMDRNVFFARRGNGIATRGPGDLKGYRIGVVEGSDRNEFIVCSGNYRRCE